MSRIEIPCHKYPRTLDTQHKIANCLQENGNYDVSLVNYNEVEKSQIESLIHNIQVR